jgi:exodeoxyribonuclease-5
MRGFVDPYPMIGEQVICLKNNREAGIFNGMIGEVMGITLGSAFHDLVINFSEDEPYSGLGLTAQFGNKQRLDHPFADCFDWAYCITVHKSQGSEWPSVMLIEERMGMMDDEQWRRWLYTGITRAKERLLIMTR